MCTAINLITNNTYFGRNMDVENPLGEKIVIIPRNYTISFKHEKKIDHHYAIMGVAAIIDNYPLLMDAINEHGLAFASLSFKDNARYYDIDILKYNYAPYELGLVILSKCKNIEEVRDIIKKINIVNTSFSKKILNTPLHFMISDKKSSIVIETTNECMKIYDNPYHVLTNNPPFSYHLENVKNYIQLHNQDARNNIDSDIEINPYSCGTGAMFLPGDYSSSSRFIKSFFVKSFIETKDDESFNMLQFFKILESVSMPRGCIKNENGYEYTLYSNCYNLNECFLYYKSYFSSEITKVSLFDEDLTLDKLVIYEFNRNFVIVKNSFKEDKLY